LAIITRTEKNDFKWVAEWETEFTRPVEIAATLCPLLPLHDYLRPVVSAAIGSMSCDEMAMAFRLLALL